MSNGFKIFIIRYSVPPILDSKLFQVHKHLLNYFIYDFSQNFIHIYYIKVNIMIIEYLSSNNSLYLLLNNIKDFNKTILLTCKKDYPTINYP